MEDAGLRELAFQSNVVAEGSVDTALNSTIELYVFIMMCV